MFFRTGEFARMLSVEKSVLIYYDRIGLFCPVHVDSNGYRCYSAEQTRDFHFIRLLRDLGLSLDEIAAALSARDAASLEALFRARASALDREIARLTALRSLRWMEAYGKGAELNQLLEKWVAAWTRSETPFGQELHPLTGEPSQSSPWYSSCMLIYLYALRRLYGL